MNTLYWHRNDLRVLDNEALVKASAGGRKMIALYVFDVEQFRMTNYGFRKTGIHRFRYLVDTLKVLRNKYKELGGDIIIRIGHPSAIIADLLGQFDIKEVYVQKEVASEEVQVEKAVQKVVDLAGATFHTIWGRTLYHMDDIPYDKESIPLTSKTFRINTTKVTEPRPVLPIPKSIDFISIQDYGELPTEVELNFSSEEIAEPRQDTYEAGIDAALKRLAYYTFESELLTSYKWTRNRSLGMDYSSKLSPFLAVGSISPRVIYWRVKAYEKEVKRNISTWWLIFEIIWRDYFTFAAWRHGNRIFAEGGIKDREVDWSYDKILFKRWTYGKTGIPFLDGHMKELSATGFMSNRGRVNAASFLTRDYKIDWRMGAAWFENRLLDYDVYSNWMNWNMQAMEIWYTNPVHQAMKYDKKGEYTLKWNPELAALPAPSFHAPWKYSDEELAFYGLTNYMRPVEIYSKWSRSINNIMKAIDPKSTL